jgi:hypothetical protein
MRIPASLGAVLIVAVFLAGCGPKIDLTAGLQVADTTSGWLDAGISEGQNKLVPTFTFTLKNVSDQTLRALDVNARFVTVNEQTEWDTSLVTVGGSSGLASGGSEHLTFTSKQGYKSPDARAEMLKNSQFVDAKVKLFAKYSNVQWVALGEYPIARQLITQ